MRRLLVLSVVVTLATACIPVTVNLTFAFPPKEMEKKLLEMEDNMRKGAEPAPKNNAPAFEPVAFVQQQPNINVETPAIKQINERRSKRFADLKGHLGAGRLGEGKDAMLAERELGDLAPKDKAAMRKHVKEENEDRTNLLKEILKANKLAEDQLDNVRVVYARALLQKAENDWWIQAIKSGKWVKKTDDHQKKLQEGKEIDE